MELSASEALFGFCGWLTSRKQRIVMSSHDNCSPIVERITEFMRSNNLPEPRKGWESCLKHPDTPPKEFLEQAKTSLNKRYTVRKASPKSRKTATSRSA